MHDLRQAWRKSLLQKWLSSDCNDAAIAAQTGLQDGINDSLVNKISNLYKQLTNPHDRAVFTGGMHTGASTRWGGIQELLDDQGNMCCPDCGCAEHPSLDHVLWRCPFYERFRNHPSPSCPLARRLGSNSNVTVSEPLDLISQMGKIRAAEVVLWHRVRLQLAEV